MEIFIFYGTIIIVIKNCILLAKVIFELKIYNSHAVRAEKFSSENHQKGSNPKLQRVQGLKIVSSRNNKYF